MQKLSEILRAQSVETRYLESDGRPFRDVRPLEELPQLVEKIEQEGGRLLGVRQFEP